MSLELNFAKDCVYSKATALSDDFRRLRSASPPDYNYSWEVENCPVCLDIHDEPKTLACKHTFCKVCLQYTIDRPQFKQDRHDERGFECVICGYFTKMINYSIPRNRWAENTPDDFRFPEVTAGDDRENKQGGVLQKNKHERLKDDNWFVIWKLSTFPKSYLLNRGLNPFKRLRNCYVFSNPVEANDKVNTEKDADGRSPRLSSTPVMPQSEIIAVTFYRDTVIVFDDGMHEIQFYNKDMTLESTFEAYNVFDIVVLNNTLYMTIPDDRCINVYDIQTHTLQNPLYLTAKCFGIDTFNDELAVLLCDENDQKFQVCLLKSIGICGQIIELKGGRLKFKCPRELAMCPITRLVYVSDEEAGLVKCFRLDGHLSWERVVLGAGSLSVYSGYLMVGREYTSSIDVLVTGGRFNGRLQSLKYEIFEPQCLAISNSTSNIVIVDGNNMIHLFSLHKWEELKATQKSSCCVLV